MIVCSYAIISFISSSLPKLSVPEIQVIADLFPVFKFGRKTHIEKIGKKQAGFELKCGPSPNFIVIVVN
jgi:hypothetical protein